MTAKEAKCSPSPKVSVLLRRVANPGGKSPSLSSPSTDTLVSLTSRFALRTKGTLPEREEGPPDAGVSVREGAAVGGKLVRTPGLLITALVFPKALTARASKKYCVVSVRVIVLPFSSCVIQPEKLLSAAFGSRVVQPTTVARWVPWTL